MKVIWATQRHNSEDLDLQHHRCENLRSCSKVGLMSDHCIKWRENW